MLKKTGDVRRKEKRNTEQEIYVIYNLLFTTDGTLTGDSAFENRELWNSI